MEVPSQQYNVLKKISIGNYLDPKSKQFRIAMVILLVVFISLVLLYIKNKVAWDKLNPIFFNNGIAGTTRTVIPGDKFYKPSSGNSFTMFFWLYVEDLNYRFGEAKNIFVKGIEGYYSDVQCPGVYISPKTNDLEFKLSPPSSVNTPNKTPISIVLDDFPVKKWFSIGLVVRNNDCEIYLDGKLSVSKPFSGDIVQNHGDLIVGGGTGNVKYIETANLCRGRGNKEGNYTGLKNLNSSIDNLCQNRDSYNRKNVTKMEQSGFNGMLSSLCYFPEAKKAHFIMLKHSRGPYTNPWYTRLWHKITNHIPKLTVNINGNSVNKYIDQGIDDLSDKFNKIDSVINKGLDKL